jgi:Glycosyltransferase family 10 (fucosyltransferase) C-term
MRTSKISEGQMSATTDVTFLTNDNSDGVVTWPFRRQLHNSAGDHKGIQFHFDGRAEAQWLVAFCDLHSSIATRVAWENRILVVTEPPSIITYTKLFANQFGVLSSPIEISGYRGRWIRSHGGLPWHYGVSFQSGIPIAHNNLSALSAQAIPLSTSRKLSVITSNKTKVARHRDRLRLVEHLKKIFPDRIDLYGRGFQPVPDKAQGIDGYRYHLVIENNVIPNFWTEKLADAFLGFALPLYSGCPNVRDYFPKDSLILLGDIRDHDAVTKQILAVLDSDPWEERIAAITEARQAILQRHNLFELISRAISSPEHPPLPQLNKSEKMHNITHQFKGPIGKLRRLANRVQVLAARR